MAPKTNRYVKKDHITHILDRPDMYVGSTRPREIEEYINSDEFISLQTVTISPALLRIFVEPLSNAVDNVERSKEAGTPCTSIKVDLNMKTGYVTIFNNGDFIPIAKNEEGNYNHSMVFGEFMTSSNYDDDEERLVSGRNGYGIKLTSVYSTHFKVEGYDPRLKKIFSQEWRNNMREADGPEITPSKGVKIESPTKGFTRITYKADFERFGIDGYSQQIFDLFAKYVFDAAMLTRVKVTLNKETIHFPNGLADYCMLYSLPEEKVDRLKFEYENSEVVITSSDAYEVISFANGVYTSKGGSHTRAWTEAVLRPIVKFYNDKSKNSNVSVSIKDVRQFFKIFISARVPNPEFESQEKHTLLVPKIIPTDFPQTKINILKKWESTKRIEDIIKRKEFSALDKTVSKTKRQPIPGLDHANKAGTKFSSECGLILCEGNSAKTYAVTGIEVGINGKKGRDYWGVLPLRGKLLNVREKSAALVAKNQVILNIIQAFGLKQNLDYSEDSNFKTLKYGRLMILADSDVDGIHISSLILNVFHCLFPTLLERDPSFLTAMQTPIVRVFLKSSQLIFYDESAFKRYATKQNKKLKVKYYKGLGTSNNKEVKETFGQKVIEFIDDEHTGPSMHKCFGKDTGIRKTWLTNFDPEKTGSYLGNDPGTMQLEISKFLNTELIKFSLDDCARSIPNLFDGLKQSQRKILYTCFARNLNFTSKVIKVAQLSGSVAEKTSYHHGEQNLYTTITKMAQAFVGSNNIPLLFRDGQFGCLDPEIPVLLWDGKIKKAKDITTGDQLIGDDGNMRRVLKTVKGSDDMYKIIQENGMEYIVNGRHILTLQYPRHKKIIWKESSRSWELCYFDGKLGKIVKRQEQTIDKNNAHKNNAHKNNAHKNNAHKNNAHKKLKDFRSSLPGDTNIFDIKLEDYLKMTKTEKESFRGFKNMKKINWPSIEVPIDPYIFGHWLGDGNADGSGFATSDPEIVKKWAVWADSIGAEVVHHPNGENHENYRYGLRRRGGTGSGVHTAVGAREHSSRACGGCLSSSKKHPACDWIFEGKSTARNIQVLGPASNGMIRKDLNPWVQILKENNLYKNKHIPREYMVNDENVRLQVLAGLIDSDGTVNSNGIYIITQESEGHGHILLSAQYIVRSLGLQANITGRNTGREREDETIINQTHLWISGANVELIPTVTPKKKINKSEKEPNTGLKIIPVGKGEFCGWSVDENERFLLGDFTVTHNSRLDMGKDAASARYIFTKLEALTRLIFRSEDDALLKHLEDDGDKIEPECYVPILPMVLINGSSGIGTGWSCNVPCFNPLDIIECIKIWLANDGRDVVDYSDPKLKFSLFPEMVPWYRGFTGKIEPDGPNKFISYGVINENAIGRTLRKVVTEIPIGMSIEKFKEMLETLEDKKLIKKFDNHSKPNKPNFTIQENPNEMECTLHSLKLQSNLRTSNIVLFVSEGKLKKFESVDEVVDVFCRARYGLYEARKKYMLNDLKDISKWTTNKRRFLEEVMEDKLILRRRDEKDIVAEMEKKSYDKKLKKPKLELERFDEEEVEESNKKETGYDYLLSLHIRSFTKAVLEKLDKEIAELQAKIKILSKTTEKELWLRDLAEFEVAYKKWLKVIGDEDESKKPVRRAGKSKK